MIIDFSQTFCGFYQVEFDFVPIKTSQAYRVEVGICKCEVRKFIQQLFCVVLPFVSAGMQRKHLGKRIFIEKHVQVPEILLRPPRETTFIFMAMISRTLAMRIPSRTSAVSRNGSVYIKSSLTASSSDRPI